jgi:mannose-1-phosphate guanylyltransferase
MIVRGGRKMCAKVRQAVIMVGGKGTRLLPLTKYRPKPVLPVLDKPCLRYLIESIAAAGIEEVFLACGFRSSQLVDAVGNGSDLGIKIEYSYEPEDSPLGTAGAIKQIENRLDDVFLAANGDVFADVLIADQINMHISSKAAVTIALTPVEKTEEFGIARLDSGGRIVEFVEKPEKGKAPSNLANAGVYIVNRSVLKYVPEAKFFDFSKNLVPILMNRGDKIQGFMLKGLWRDVGRPSDLLGANLALAAKLYDDMRWGGRSAEGTTVRKPFFMGKGTTITSSEVTAAVVLDGCTVKDSKITNSMIMKGCSIVSARVENSIIGEGCRVLPGASVLNEVLGDGTVVEAGKEMTGKTVFE